MPLCLSAVGPQHSFPRGPCWSLSAGCARYLSLAFWPSRQARNAASACSRSSALLSLRRACLGCSPPDGILPLTSSTPCRRIRLRLLIRDQLTRAPTTKRPLRQARKIAARALLGLSREPHSPVCVSILATWPSHPPAPHPNAKATAALNF